MPVNLFKDKKIYHILLWLFGGLAVINFVNEAVVNTLLSDQVDFQPYYDAARRLAEGGNPYVGRGLPFLYPLPFLWLILPLSRLSYSAASGIWFAANIIMYIAVLSLLSYRLIRCYTGQARRTGLLLLVIAFLMFSPSAASILYGQVGVLVLFLLMFGYDLFVLSESRESAAGKIALEVLAALLICAAVFIRISPVIFVLYFFMIRRGRLAVFMILWGILIELASIGVHGIELNLQIITYVPSHVMNHGMNISLMQLLNEFRVPGMIGKTVFAVYALDLVLVSFYLLKKYGWSNPGLGYGLVIVLVTCIQPFLEIHHLTLLLVPFGIIIVENLEEWEPVDWLVIIGSWIIPAFIHQVTVESFLKGQAYLVFLPLLSIWVLFIFISLILPENR